MDKYAIERVVESELRMRGSLGIPNEAIEAIARAIAAAFEEYEHQMKQEKKK